MNRKKTRGAEALRRECAEKLHPARLQVSGTFHAVLAFLLREKGWTRPEMAELVITSDHHLLGRKEGDCGFNDYVGHAADLFANLEGVAKCVGLTPQATEYLITQAESCRIVGGGAP